MLRKVTQEGGLVACRSRVGLHFEQRERKSIACGEENPSLLSKQNNSNSFVQLAQTKAFGISLSSLGICKLSLCENVLKMVISELVEERESGGSIIIIQYMCVTVIGIGNLALFCDRKTLQ